MLRTKFFAPTLRETPAEATATSHRLMLRAGLVRMLSAGVYSYLPLGWRAALKAVNVVREEMNRIGAQEFLLPALTPLEIWDETGRSKDFGEEMFRLCDRKSTSHCLAPTHEEIICSLARGEVRSWRDLPQIWYQIQTKFRDEPRPRGGMLRMRQFLMKDAYSLDRNEEGLDKSYELHRQAYERIFQRCGLDYFIVGAFSGLMGGGQSQEFMIESDAGEDQVARCNKCGFAANLEVATAIAPPAASGEKSTLMEVPTPGMRTVEEVSRFLKIPKGRLVKTLIYVSPTGPIMALIAGDDDLSEAKLTAVAGGPVRPAHAEEALDWMKAEVGFLGPQGSHGLTIYADLRLEDAVGLASGANRNGFHVVGLTPGRDFHPDEWVDLRTIKSGEGCPVCGKPLNLVKAIELGHIFKLGVKYSQAMNAVFLDELGREQPIIMGSYGIGIERILAASVEGHADQNGIRWNSALSPLDVAVIPIGGEEQVRQQAMEVYDLLNHYRFETLLDDREASPGVKLKDADLFGLPVQVIISKRNLDNGKIEIKNRWTSERSYVTLEGLQDKVQEIIESCRPEIKDGSIN